MNARAGQAAHQSPHPAAATEGRFRPPSRARDLVIGASGTAAAMLAAYQIFSLGSTTGVIILENRFYYLLLALLLPAAFVQLPATAAGRGDPRIPLRDWIAAAAAGAICLYYAWHAETMIVQAWEYTGPPVAVAGALVLWALLLEIARRAAGRTLFALVAVLSLYPIYADRMPGVFEGLGQTLPQTASYHVMSQESVLGLPIKAFGRLVVGFLVFGVALQFTGAGRFFIDLAFALFGHVRGGAAKVAVFASGLMGSMSGSVTSNVLTTGSMSIPAMTRSGFPRLYAAALEACASTGGTLMPPIMGATAFVMANFLAVSYVEVAIAAALPSLLYFLALFLQVDAHAARRGIEGLPRAELPRLGATLRRGWPYLAVFAVLIWILIGLKREAQAPFIATALLLAVNQARPGDRLDLAGMRAFAVALGRLLVEIGGILAAIGLVVGALVATGMVGTLSNDLVHLAGGSTLALLIMGAITSFILGIGMTVTAAYVFLAVILAPALSQTGLEPMAVHLFILYWAMLSFITPPVAIGAFAAASVAGTAPMATGLMAVRLGAILYVLPFFFVYNPALLLIGAPGEVLAVTATAVAGVACVAAGLQGHLLGVGTAPPSPAGVLARTALVAGGLALVAPGFAPLGLGHGALAAVGAGLVALAALTLRTTRDRGATARMGAGRVN